MPKRSPKPSMPSSCATSAAPSSAGGGAGHERRRRPPSPRHSSPRSQDDRGAASGPALDRANPRRPAGPGAALLVGPPRWAASRASALLRRERDAIPSRRSRETSTRLSSSSHVDFRGRRPRLARLFSAAASCRPPARKPLACRLSRSRKGVSSASAFLGWCCIGRRLPGMTPLGGRRSFVSNFPPFPTIEGREVLRFTRHRRCCRRYSGCPAHRDSSCRKDLGLSVLMNSTSATPATGYRPSSSRW